MFAMQVPYFQFKINIENDIPNNFCYCKSRLIGSLTVVLRIPNVLVTLWTLHTKTLKLLITAILISDVISAERQRVHRKKRIAVSADLLNGPADDSDSDDQHDTTTTGESN